MSDAEGEDLAPTEAFGVLGDETRLAIVEELAEATGGSDGEGLSFSELRKRVGVRDAGQFNYHLSKLRDRFVVKRDGEYHPRYAALRAVGAVESGTYTELPRAEASETDFDCPECGELLTATYEHGLVTLDCPNHDTIFETGVPPRAAADRSVEELLTFANADTQRDTERAVAGTCPLCWGRVSTTAPHYPGDDSSEDRSKHGDAGNESDDEHAEDRRVYVKLDCQNCWMSMRLPVGGALLRHPAVVSFYYDHGIDVRQRPYLSLDFMRDPDSTTVVSEEPVRMSVTTELDGDRLALTVDDDLNVLDVERHSVE